MPSSKNTLIGTSAPATKVENVCSFNWSTLDDTKTKAARQVADLSETKQLGKPLLPEIPPETNLELEANTKYTHETVTPDADIPEEARARLKELLEKKYTSIILQCTTDIGRTNLLEFDIPTKGPPIALKPYSVPLKYREFVDQEIKQLEEAGIISRSMSDWANLILMVPKKDDRPAPTEPNSSISQTYKTKERLEPKALHQF